MAQTTPDASFGPVFVAAAFHKPLGIFVVLVVVLIVCIVVVVEHAMVVVVQVVVNRDLERNRDTYCDTHNPGEKRWKEK